ncbi:response regulator [Oscillatoria sp. FACHB-1407]|uniref:hybrid sensor histidine kinase/response regulator n=1 Tax=Oscillatoria sp. FACHB-1407 TaxID=2692847 RepID=UPI001688E008|nr:response regulator [Oscillatoria sp. FACHB-1407]MBD2462664.1 response regulator [Oscillatoria sp. FACHB-1407]
MSKILVIEDETLLLESLLELLDAEGFEAIGAENGQIGIQLIQETLPDLVICDILMPELDGLSVLQQSREDATTALIPFIFLTAKGTWYEVRQGMNLGADDYLTKPFKQTDLLQAIAVRLSKREAIINLQEKIEQLEQANLLKEQFLETASDELRVPITNIKIAVQMLYEAPTRERQKQYFELLQAECNREINLLNNLLDLHKLETNTRPFRLESISFQKWIPTITEAFQKQLKTRQQTLQVTVSPYLPKLMFDGADLQSIVGELLNNACKYTAPQGNIVLEVYRNPLPPISGISSSPLTTIVVSNQAELSAEVIPQLFDQFYRVPGGDRWKQGGSGLGLALVKKLIERVGGTIHIISEGGWVHVHVYLPLQPSV